HSHAPSPTPHHLHSFPTRRSSDLDLADRQMTARFETRALSRHGLAEHDADRRPPEVQLVAVEVDRVHTGRGVHVVRTAQVADLADRKSTRLNSSHRTISYAVFCLK